MKVTFGSYQRCLKKFNPIPIIAKYADNQNAEYLIFDRKANGIIGKFEIHGSNISDLKLDSRIRRKKTAVDAILSIREFILKKAKENNWDFVTFATEFKNHNNTKRLYQQLGAEYIGKDADGEHFVGVFNTAKKSIILERFNFLNDVGNSLEKIKTNVKKLIHQ